jgi:hypothetical protein
MRRLLKLLSNRAPLAILYGKSQVFQKRSELNIHRFFAKNKGRILQALLPSIQGIHELIQICNISIAILLYLSPSTRAGRCTCTSRRKKSRYAVLQTFMFKLIWKHETTGRRIWRWMRHKSSEEAKATAKSTAMHQKKQLSSKLTPRIQT